VCAFASVLCALVVLAGCSSDDADEPCEAARKKLAACKNEIDEAIAISGMVSLPVTFTGECTGRNLCVAECARNPDCTELAAGISGGISDPNAPPMTGEFLGCALGCLHEGLRDGGH
jgi:hypothetical protein